MFECFEEILMAVIKNTLHNDDMCDKTSPFVRMRKSDEERFDDAMVAIFGKQYERQFKKTNALSTTELLAIKRKIDEGETVRSAVKNIVHGRQNREIGTQSASLNVFYDQARKHFERNEDHYKNPTHPNNLTPLEEGSLFSTERIKAREEIFKTLRSAGWMI